MQLADLADSGCMGRYRLTIPLQEQNAAMIEGALAIDLGGALLGTLLFYCVMYALKRKKRG
jgi:hypothetical protein